MDSTVNHSTYCQCCSQNYGNTTLIRHKGLRKGKQRYHWAYGICNICVHRYLKNSKDISDKKFISCFYPERTECECSDENFNCACNGFCKGDFLVFSDVENIWYRGCLCYKQNQNISVKL